MSSPSSFSLSHPPSSTTSPSPVASKRKSAVGPIIGGVLGSSVVALLLVAWCCLRRRFRLESLILKPSLYLIPPVGQIRSASKLALGQPAPSAVIESQAAMLQRANASSPALPAPEMPSVGISNPNPAAETQLQAVVARLALVEAALTARDAGEDLPPDYSPG
ncbi:hypothetical protein FB45DRAFT_1106494 [Roridomyces roridus]|uniref:Uncharacterized protein n=1 Tax=Roridomyces roridus TaxID=1738132 RepID=A0AAD7AX73_9AGAR|nr:hypothetical protein FB45DRAFT_1106494 [Roridomyces roridus]